MLVIYLWRGKKRVIIQQQNYTTWIPFPFAGPIDNSCDLLITAYLHYTIFLLVCMLCMCLNILVQDGSREMQHLILSNDFGGTESGDHFNIGYMNCSISDVCTSEQKLWDDVRIFSSLFFYSLFIDLHCQCIKRWRNSDIDYCEVNAPDW